MNVRKLSRKYRDRVNELLEAHRRVTSTLERRRRVMRQIDQIVRLRCASLDALLYPLLDETAKEKSAARRVVRLARSADQALVTRLTLVGKIQSDGARYDRAVKALCADIAGQFEIQREQVLPRIEKQLDSVERKTLGDAIEALEGQLANAERRPARNSWRASTATARREARQTRRKEPQ